MAYIESSLTSDETVIYLAKTHWAFFSTPVVYSLVATLFLFDGLGEMIRLLGLGGFNEKLGFTQLLANVSTATGLGAHTIVSYSFFVIAGIYLYTHLIRFFTTEIGLTNQRVIVKVGWLRIDTVELLLDKVETIMVHQGLFGRIFSFGTIAFIGAGNSGGNFTWVSDPMKFKEMVQEQIESGDADAEPMLTDAYQPDFEV
jgi:hypothetical protein